jgi:hypothetical protein
LLSLSSEKTTSSNANDAAPVFTRWALFSCAVAQPQQYFAPPPNANVPITNLVPAYIDVHLGNLGPYLIGEVAVVLPTATHSGAGHMLADFEGATVSVGTGDNTWNPCGGNGGQILPLLETY